MKATYNFSSKMKKHYFALLKNEPQTWQMLTMKLNFLTKSCSLGEKLTIFWRKPLWMHFFVVNHSFKYWFYFIWPIYLYNLFDISSLCDALLLHLTASVKTTTRGFGLTQKRCLICDCTLLWCSMFHVLWQKCFRSNVKSKNTFALCMSKHLVQKKKKNCSTCKQAEESDAPWLRRDYSHSLDWKQRHCAAAAQN